MKLNESGPAVHSSPCRVVVPLAGRHEPLARARARIRRELASVLPCVDDLLLILSELGGNAVRHTAAGPDYLTVEAEADRVIVAVHDPEPDGGPVPPSESAGDPLAESGRGLWLVQALAQCWYVERTAVGKAVVAVLPFGSPSVSRGASP